MHRASPPRARPRCCRPSAAGCGRRQSPADPAGARLPRSRPRSDDIRRGVRRRATPTPPGRRSTRRTSRSSELPREVSTGLRRNLRDWIKPHRGPRRPGLQGEGDATPSATETPTPTPTETADGDADRDPHGDADADGDADRDPHADADADGKLPGEGGVPCSARTPDDRHAVRRPLPARPPPRRRRHGDRAARVRHPPRALRRGQAAGRAPGRGLELRVALPPRGARRRPARAPEHRAGLRLRARRGHRRATSSSWSSSTASRARRSCATAGRSRPREAVEIIGQACRGLDYAHRNGVVHRDVKPGNLLRSRDDAVKLADFGIAKAAEQSDITKVGSVLGTAAYLSPSRRAARRPARRRTCTRSASSPTSCSPAACPTRPPR